MCGCNSKARIEEGRSSISKTYYQVSVSISTSFTFSLSESRVASSSSGQSFSKRERNLKITRVQISPGRTGSCDAIPIAFSSSPPLSSPPLSSPAPPLPLLLHGMPFGSTAADTVSAPAYLWLWHQTGAHVSMHAATNSRGKQAFPHKGKHSTGKGVGGSTYSKYIRHNLSEINNITVTVRLIFGGCSQCELGCQPRVI